MESFIKSLILGLASGGIYALVAVSYVIIYKATRIFAFSQAGMLIIGSWHPLWLP